MCTSAVDTYSRQGKLAYVHFRNIRGKVPYYRETFIDDGDVDMLRVLRILKQNAFDGRLDSRSCPANGVRCTLARRHGVRSGLPPGRPRSTSESLSNRLVAATIRPRRSACADQDAARTEDIRTVARSPSPTEGITTMTPGDNWSWTRAMASGSRPTRYSPPGRCSPTHAAEETVPRGAATPDLL